MPKSHGNSVLQKVGARLSERYIGPYIERLESQGVPTQPKQVHDTVWGTISLTPLEVALLDSPLLQRLRHLRQLGVAHWVYPSAGHSRFEHSLGVLYQAQQLINAINQSSLVRYSEELIGPNDQTVLRCAALLHDIGHPVLSHVSEYAVKLDPPTLLALVRERRQVGEDAKLSEIIAASVVKSEQFQKLLGVVARHHLKANLPTAAMLARPEEFSDKIAKCILGQKISHTAPLMHEIISGPFDADKLDYMVRDAAMAGIPGIIDISRLVQKATVLRLPKRDLPSRIARDTPQSVPEASLTGFPWSGLSVVDELLLTKMILFSKLYQHPKVVAAESMIQLLVEMLWNLVGTEQVLHFIYDVLDEELVFSDSAALIRRLNIDNSALDESRQRSLSRAVDIIERLRDRRLFVRAFAFSAHNPGLDESSATPIDSPFVKLAKRLSDDAALTAFRGEVAAQLNTIITLLEPEELSNLIEPTSYFVVRKKNLPSQEELRRAYIFPNQGRPKTFGETGIHKDAWSSSFVSAAPKGYIFAPKELAPFTFVATEAAIAAEFGVGIPDWLMEEAKQSETVVRPIKMRLRAAGFYRGKPRVIRPVGERLQMADAEQVVHEFAERFSAVQETVREYSKSSYAGAESMRRRALDWLDQFDDELVECALDVLSRCRLLGRRDVVGAFSAFLNKHPEFRSASVVGLSAGNESSQIVQYYLGDVGGDLRFYPTVHDVTTRNPEGPVLFVDDFCGSGGQVKNILGGWFGDSELKKPEMNEQRELILADHKTFLAERKIGFFFVAGRTDGLQEVRGALKKLKLDGEVYAEILDEDIPTAFNSKSDQIEPETWEAFRDRCAAIGRELLGPEKWAKKKLDERVLGYGNEALLLFFPYNSPAQSLTCMWAEGTVAGDEWLPLVARRKKVVLR